MASFRLPQWGALAFALALYAAVFALRASDPNVADAEGILYVLPVGVLALGFGRRGGLAGGLVGCLLVLAWRLSGDHRALSMLGYLDRAVAFVLLGLLVGTVVDRRHKLEGEIALYYQGSLDMLATADFSGRFTRVNPAWERTLGHSVAAMTARPFTDFVHPDDVAATNAEMAALRSGRVCRGFRNRYRAADGRYHWLEWSASATVGENAIHAVARDITEQRIAEQRIARSADRLREMVSERTYELDRARSETLQLLALAGEYRDDDTSAHTERVAAMAAELAQRLGLDDKTVVQLREAALLHDLGKIAIPDDILMNPGTLSATEVKVMRTHVVIGARLLRGTGSPVLQMASVVAASHHEWWDGSGYPAGLAGERIPLVGRIVTVADVFDALTHDRPYKPAWPVERAIARIERGAGTQFDPRVVAAFMEMPHRLTEVVVPDALPRHLAPSETPQRRWGAVAQAEPPTLARPA
jgi:PAS domain S-box-containing protein/putative nucleotidyltransferase with HDIG domain